MARKIFLLAVYYSFFNILLAQNFVFSPHKFGVNLFAGGIDTPRFQFVDIDGDNDNDLFILDRDEKVWFYRNGNGSLQLEPNTTFGITVGSWFRFVDIDGDGDSDCMTNGNFSEVSLFSNVGSQTAPQFQLTTSALLDTSGEELFSERYSIPTFADIDDDGDVDFFTGGSIGSITYYKNIGTKVSPQYTFITSVYQGINIQGGPVSLPKPMHGASGIEFFDVDSNGVMDLFWGDYFNRSLYYLQNTGTKQNAIISLVDSTYPNEDVVKSFGFNFPQHADVDHDGTFDLMIGCVFPNIDYDNFMFYKNIGSNANPFYSLQTKNFIPMIDVGSRSTIAASDFDGDGDCDLCVASGSGKISIYQNSGSLSHPVYSALPTSTLTLPGEFNAAIASGDLNGDNVPDLLAGTYDHGLKTFINSSSNGSISFVPQNHPVNAFTPGQSSAPCVADIDHDGITDILVGNSSGQLWLLKNTGTNSSPVYGAIINFDSIDVGNDAIPCLCDFDNDGKWDLLIGNSDGNIWYYRQTTSTSLKFELINKKFQNIDLKTQAAPAVVDIDSDGDRDLLLGNGKGGIFFYENTASSYIQDEKTNIPADITLHQNFPNPFNPSTTIEFEVPSNGYVELTVFDILGKEVASLVREQKPQGKYSARFNGDGLSSGVYFYRLRSGNFFSTKKLLLIK